MATDEENALNISHEWSLEDEGKGDNAMEATMQNEFGAIEEGWANFNDFPTIVAPVETKQEVKSKISLKVKKKSKMNPSTQSLRVSARSERDLEGNEFELMTIQSPTPPSNPRHYLQLSSSDPSLNEEEETMDDNFHYTSSSSNELECSCGKCLYKGFYILLNLPKYLWFEHVAYYKARYYLYQVFSICFAFIVIEVSVFLYFKYKTHQDHPEINFLPPFLTGGINKDDFTTMYFGELDSEKILCDHQYYLVITQIFLHRNYQHLWDNVHFQLWYNCYYNILFGNVNFLLIWFIGGIYGAINHMIQRPTHTLVGASGALFALDGAYLIWFIYNVKDTIRRPIWRQYFAYSNFAFVAANSYDALTADVNGKYDKTDHVGGFWAGLLLGVVLFRGLKPEEEEKYEEKYNQLSIIGRGWDETMNVRCAESWRVCLISSRCKWFVLICRIMSVLVLFAMLAYALRYLLEEIRPMICHD